MQVQIVIWITARVLITLNFSSLCHRLANLVPSANSLNTLTLLYKLTRSRLEVEVEDLEVIKQGVARAMQSRNSKLILCPFCFFDKIDHPFCLQNCFFLLAAHFAQILLSKFCQGLVTCTTIVSGALIMIIIMM